MRAYSDKSVFCDDGLFNQLGDEIVTCCPPPPPMPPPVLPSFEPSPLEKSTSRRNPTVKIECGGRKCQVCEHCRYMRKCAGNTKMYTSTSSIFQHDNLTVVRNSWVNIETNTSTIPPHSDFFEVKKRPNWTNSSSSSDTNNTREWEPYSVSRSTSRPSTRPNSHRPLSPDQDVGISILEMTWEKKLGTYTYRSIHKYKPPPPKIQFWRRVLYKVIILSCDLFKMKYPPAVRRQYEREKEQAKRTPMIKERPRRDYPCQNVVINTLQFFCTFYSHILLRNWLTCLQSLNDHFRYQH